jgi:hypothetical protein
MKLNEEKSDENYRISKRDEREREREKEREREREGE